MMRNSAHRAFTLTEMLVVVGIIVVLVSLLLPAVMRARNQSRQAVCMGNLRQIGQLYLLYAERNEDYIPLGTSRFKDPNRPGVEHYTPRKLPENKPWPWPGYHTRNNQYLWVEGAPSAAMGPFLLAKLISSDSAKILFCPSEKIPIFRWEYNRADFARALAGERANIRIGMAVRPIRRLWTHDHTNGTVEYPPLMPKLTRNDRIAIVAEHPQYQPYNHGTENDPTFNALFGDGSVRTIPGKSFKPTYEQYLAIDKSSGYPEGYSTASNNYSMSDDPSGQSIWTEIDRH